MERIRKKMEHLEELISQVRSSTPPIPQGDVNRFLSL